MRIVLLGAGGHAKVVASALQGLGWDLVAALDDQVPVGTPFMGVQVEGKLDSFARYSDVSYCVAIGNNEIRGRVFEVLRAQGCDLPVVVHPAAHVEPTAVLGDGTVVLARAYIGPEVQIGAGCIVNTSSLVLVHSVLGRFVHVCPGAKVEANVGDFAMIGTGACVARVRVGDGSCVGAGAVVSEDVPSGAVAVGNPARLRDSS